MPSNCCKSGVKVVGGVTKHYECSGCGKDCNDVPELKVRRPEKLITEMVVNNPLAFERATGYNNACTDWESYLKAQGEGLLEKNGVMFYQRKFNLGYTQALKLKEHFEAFFKKSLEEALAVKES